MLLLRAEDGDHLNEPIRDKGELQAFYDDPEVVSTYLRRTSRPIGAVLHERQVAFLNGLIRDLAPERVLEIAPGPARLSAELDPVPVAVGMDFSPRMLADAGRRIRERGLRWNLVRGDGFALPFATGTFDLVFSVRFVRRFEPEPRQKLYGEIRRVLRPGGHLVLDAQNRLVAGPHREGRTGYPVYDELWLRDELVSELESAGFAVRHLEGIMRRFRWQWQVQRLQRFGVGALARTIIRALERTPDDNPSTWMMLCQTTGSPVRRAR
ncbi:MAG TPA: class I SAM-dependent methyltransferase [Candidatus Binatus sp.]|nr:class I SAM-dependent methyltransferase [Candidatus Binatus sp.]